MSLETGWWVHPDSRKIVSVRDHARDVFDDPAKFHLPQHDVDAAVGAEGARFNQWDDSKDSARGRLVQAAGRHGWVRVRSYRGGTTLQVHGRAASRVKAAGEMLVRAKKISSDEPLRVADTATGFAHFYPGGLDEFRRHARSSAVPDHDGVTAVGPETGGKDGVVASLPDSAKRTIMRQRLLAKAGIHERYLPEAQIAQVAGTSDPTVGSPTLGRTMSPPAVPAAAGVLVGDALVDAIRKAMNGQMGPPVMQAGQDNGPPDTVRTQAAGQLTQAIGLR